MSNKELRNCQVSAMEIIRNTDTPLINMFPGTGKTVVGCETVSFYTSQKNTYAVVVVPTDTLRSQWVQDAADEGINLYPLSGSKEMAKPPAAYKGIVTTYQSLGSLLPNLNIWVTNGWRVVFVFDEPHHAGENRAWGECVERCGEIARKSQGNCVLLTGTAFRSDGTEIPLVKYKDGYSVADYTYTYGEALTDPDGVVRPVEIILLKGKTEMAGCDGTPAGVWEWDKVSATDASNAIGKSFRIGRGDNDTIAAFMATAIEKMQSVLKADMDLLLGTGKPLPVGSFHCMSSDPNGETGNQYVNLVAKRLRNSGHSSKTLSSDMDPSEVQSVLKMFRMGTDARWLVSCNMFTEGVSVKNARVGCYMKNTLNLMALNQVLGRYVRWERHLDENQSGVLILPHTQLTKEWADSIRKETKVALSKRREAAEAGDGQQGAGLVAVNAEVLGGITINSGTGDEFGNDDYYMRRAEIMMRRGLRFPATTIAAILKQDDELQGDEYALTSGGGSVASDDGDTEAGAAKKLGDEGDKDIQSKLFHPFKKQMKWECPGDAVRFFNDRCKKAIGYYRKDDVLMNLGADGARRRKDLVAVVANELRARFPQ